MTTETTAATVRELRGEWRDRSAIPDLLIWGPESYKQLPGRLAELGCSRVVLLASGSLARRTPWVDRVRDLLGELVVGARSDSQEFTPDWLCFDAANWARPQRPDAIVTIGGGSVADWGKAVCFALAQELSSVEELDSFVASPENQQLTALANPPMPLVCLPTTLSASESSWSVTINRPARKFKDHVRHTSLVANTVIFDGAIAASTPVDLWCATGLKAMEHVVEKMYTIDRNPIVDVLCTEAGGLLNAGLRRCKDRPDDAEARTQCQLALMMCSFHGRGVHKGLSQVIGWQLGAYGVSHGHTSCIMLPHVMRFNRPVSEPAQAALGRAFGGTATGDAALAEYAADAVAALVQDLGLPSRLRDVGIDKADLPAIAEKVVRSPNIIYNPIPVRDPALVLSVLEQAF